MREIKFRQPRFNDNGKFIDWFYWGFVNGGFTSPLKHNVKNYQYTGLKDKNDKEIYENDIIRYKESVKEEIYGLRVAKFYINRFELENARTYGWKGGWGETGYCGGDAKSEWICQRDCEILGSIDENPELLEEDE